MNELLPCPFCGDEAMMVEHHHGTAFVVCTNGACQCQTVICDEKGAKELWNAREPIPNACSTAAPEMLKMLEVLRRELNCAEKELAEKSPNWSNEFRKRMAEIDELISKAKGG